jgi:hypothetical protein
MKRTIIAFAAAGAFTFASLGTTAQPIQPDTAIVVSQDEREEIKYDELPDVVKQSFEESQYSDWEVSKVYKVEVEEGTQYELTISDGSQAGTLAYDEQGNMIEL